MMSGNGVCTTTTDTRPTLILRGFNNDFPFPPEIQNSESASTTETTDCLSRENKLDIRRG